SLNDTAGNFDVDADLSDHWPVEFTWGTDQAFCAPHKAFDYVTVPNNVKTFQQVLTYNIPGALQWVRIPANTPVIMTAEMATGPSGASSVELTPFMTTDISMPLELFGGSPIQGPQGIEALGPGAVLSYPFDVYVRVRATNPAFVGSGNLMFTRLDGSDFERALPISMTGYPQQVKQDFSYGHNWQDEYSAALTMAASQLGQPGQEEMWLRFNVNVKAPATDQCLNVHLMQDHWLNPSWPLMGPPRKYGFAVYDGAKNVLQNFTQPE